MTPDCILLVTRAGWQQLRAGTLTDVAAFPQLDGPTVVVTDFEEAPTGCYRFDGGKTAYAAPMVEKRARTEGLAEAASHVAVHRTLAVQGGFQTFHTVVPLDFWQRLVAWAAQQADHCLVLPMGAVLSNGLAVDSARVVCVGRSLHGFAHTSAGLAYASAAAASQDPDDMLAAVRVLARVMRADLGKGLEGPVEWLQLLTTDAALDAAMRLQWAESAVVAAEGPPVHLLAAPVGSCATALPDALRSIGAGGAVNPPVARWAWRTERLMPVTAAIVGVVAAGLLAAGLYSANEAKAQRTRAAQVASELQVLEGRIDALNAQEVPAGFAAVAQFARKLGDGARYDPLPMLTMLRQAAGTDVSVQRLRLESAPDGERGFRVDGRATSASTTAMSDFLSRLRDAGWVARSLDPADTAAGAFSYRLTARTAAGG